MRTILIIIFSIILLLPQANAQESVSIRVSRDTTIDVREALKLDEQGNTFLYGEKVGGTKYGGEINELFKEHQVGPNKKNAGIEIIRNDSGRIQVKVIFSAVGGTCKLNFKRAKEDSLGNGNWLPDDDNICRLVISKENLPVGDESYSTENMYYLFYGILILVLICVLAVAVSIKKQIKRAKEGIYERIGELSESISAIGAGSASPDTKKQVVSANKQPALTKDDIRRIVNSALDEKLKSFTFARNTDFERGNANPVHGSSSSSVLSLNEAGNEPSSSSFDTDDVIFHEDQKYFSIEETDTKIFRIYSKGNDYYYTIIDDDDVRNEFLSVIDSYKSCVSLKNPEFCNPKSVKPCQDGKLNKYGDRYFIDESHKLELELV